MAFKDLAIMSHPMGSRYTCTPPVMDTDKDTVILVRDVAEAEQALLEEGWAPCGKGEYVDTYFKAFRKGEDNYVITAEQLFFERYLLAAQVCRALNVQEKEQRSAIHTALLNAGVGFMGLIDWNPGAPTQPIAIEIRTL